MGVAYNPRKPADPNPAAAAPAADLSKNSRLEMADISLSFTRASRVAVPQDFPVAT
jgi:hypothetical protein